MPYTTITRAQLRVRLQQRWESTPFWTDADANVVINRTLRLWNALTGYWRAPLTTATIPNDPMVPLAGTLVQQTAVRVNGVTLRGCSTVELNQMVPNWWYARAAATSLPSRPYLWAPVGLNLIVLWPAPTSILTVVMDGIRQTPVLTADGDSLDIGPEELNTLLGYMLHDAALAAGAGFVERTKPGLEAFIQAAARRNRFLRETTWYTRLNEEGYPWALQPEGVPVGDPRAETSA